MFKRNSTLIKDIILKNLRDQGLETPLLQKRLIDAWPVVMGEAIASYTASLNIRNQTLFVHLTNPALRMELSMQRQDIVRRLNERRQPGDCRRAIQLIIDSPMYITAICYFATTFTVVLPISTIPTSPV